MTVKFHKFCAVILVISAVISIKHVSTFVNKVENPYVTTMIFDLIDKCRYVFYAYDGRYKVQLIKFLKHSNTQNLYLASSGWILMQDSVLETLLDV